jgi:hypothetical protein
VEVVSEKVQRRAAERRDAARDRADRARDRAARQRADGDALLADAHEEAAEEQDRVAGRAEAQRIADVDLEGEQLGEDG